MRILPFLLLAAVLPGCLSGMGYSTADQVLNAAREYNQDVRWGRYDQAADHIPKDERERYVERRTALEDNLEIADFELVNIVIDKKKSTAVARVEYTWTLKDQGIVKKTTTKQSWEKQGQAWVVAKETRVKGSPLVLFDEPAKDPVKTAQ